MTKDEALRLALDALTTLNAADDDRDFLCLAETDMLYAAIDACRAALSAPAAQPVPVVQPLTDEQIEAMKREAADQGLTGIPPSRHLARAVERACAEAWGVKIGGANG